MFSKEVGKKTCGHRRLAVENGTNFKIINEGNAIPFWLGGVFGKEQIYGALAAVCAGKITGLNLVEMSQLLKS